MTETARTVTGPDFLIVGSPRSGTTLVQRLASELPGVRVTPETHFFSVFFGRSLRGGSFPLDAEALRRVLGDYLDLPPTRGLDIDIEGVVRALDGRCADAWSLFGALVDQLGGEAAVVGEKTPDHLRWWRPLMRARPGLRLVAVLRDPRAVVASALDVPFGMDSAPLLAASWRQDFRELTEATRTLGDARILTLRYEDVVTRPEAARDDLAEFLRIPGGSGPTPPQTGELFQPWEARWKARAQGPVDPGRADAWRTRLTGRQRRQVEAIVGPALTEAGYLASVGEDPRLLRELGPADWVALARFHRSRQVQRRRIERTVI